MKKHLICPICQAVNEVDSTAVGCYVLCRNCPHRFYVPVPPLGEDLKDEPIQVPNVVPDYKAWEQQQTKRANEVEGLAAQMKWQRTLLLALLVAQGIMGLMLVGLLYLVGR